MCSRENALLCEPSGGDHVCWTICNFSLLQAIYLNALFYYHLHLQDNCIKHRSSVTSCVFQEVEMINEIKKWCKAKRRLLKLTQSHVKSQPCQRWWFVIRAMLVLGTLVHRPWRCQDPLSTWLNLFTSFLSNSNSNSTQASSSFTHPSPCQPSIYHPSTIIIFITTHVDGAVSNNTTTMMMTKINLKKSNAVSGSGSRN